MKNFLTAFALIIVALTFASCRSHKPAPEIIYLPGQTKTVRDTVTVTIKEIVRDTVYKKAASKASAKVPLKDIKSGFKTDFKSNDASGSIREKDGNLEVDCGCDSLNVLLKLRDKEINTLRDRATETGTLHPVQYTPWYIKALAWVGGAAVVLILLVLIAKKLKWIK